MDLSQPALQALLTSLTDSLRHRLRPGIPTASRHGWETGSGSSTWLHVTHFFAEDKLTYAVEGGKSYCVDYTIVQLEKRTGSQADSCASTAGTLVNTAWIKEVASLPGGGLNVRLKDGRNTDLTVSRDRAREFKARLLAR